MVATRSVQRLGSARPCGEDLAAEPEQVVARGQLPGPGAELALAEVERRGAA